MSDQKATEAAPAPGKSRSTGGREGTVRAEIDAGICGFKTVVIANGESMREVRLAIESDCPQIQKAAEELGVVNMLEELRAGLGQGHVYQVLAGNVRHVMCPVGSGILKAAEAAAGLALPKEVCITITKE